MVVGYLAFGRAADALQRRGRGSLPLLVGGEAASSLCLAFLIAGVGIFAMFAGGGGLQGGAPAGATAGAVVTVLLAVLIAIALALPLVMALWFAPALVVFHELDAVAAMKASFTGCLRNIVPFLVYGIVGLLLAVVAMIPLGLGWLVLGPVLAASVYASYRDIYLR
jgi:uncharacterized membrane protein